MDHVPTYAAAVAVASIAVYTDTKRGLIPNWLTFPAIGVALALRTTWGGADGLLLALQGAALGLGLLLIPFMVGGMGAGDVKLLTALGAFVGPEHIFVTFFFSALLGGAIGLLLLIRRFGWQTAGMTALGGWGGVLLSTAHGGTRMGAFPFASSIFFGLFASMVVR